MNEPFEQPNIKRRGIHETAYIDQFYCIFLAIVSDTSIADTLPDRCPAALAIIHDYLVIHIATPFAL